MITESRNSTIILGDGRHLGYYEFGDPAGWPVLYFHGSGMGSGIAAAALSDAAFKRGLRLIAPDRPGIGLSDLQKDRKIMDWPIDVKELTERLNINKFDIISESGGSAYAYSCAAVLPDRVRRLLIVSGICPLDDKSLTEGLPFEQRMMLGILKYSPAWLLRKMFSGTKRALAEDAGKYFEKTSKRALPIEKKILLDKDFQEHYKSMVLNALKNGLDSAIHDIRLIPAPWGVDLKSLKCRIEFWHGEKDMSAPVLMTKALERLLQSSKACYFPEEGHLSVMQLHSGDILDSLKNEA